MSQKSPAYRWYPKDILGSLRVAAMTAAEECWYRRALDFAWLNEGIPADPVRLSRIVGKKCTKAGAEIVLSMFTPSPTDSKIYINERQEIERQKQKEWSEKSSNGGKKSKPPNPKQKGSKKEPPLEVNPAPKVNIPFASVFATTEPTVPTCDAPLTRPGECSRFPLVDLYEAFPNLELTSAQMGMITSSVTVADAPAWKATILQYVANYDPSRNRYLPEKVGNLLSVFQAKKDEIERQNGTNIKNSGRRTDQQAIAESVDYYENFRQS
jgi:hypothetical protein